MSERLDLGLKGIAKRLVNDGSEYTFRASFLTGDADWLVAVALGDLLVRGYFREKMMSEKQKMMERNRGK